MLLLIETATEVCSVCLEHDGLLLSIEEAPKEYSHAEMLTVMIEQLLKKSKVSFKELDAVAVSKGPGSYTGLRIGASVAKGLCYAMEKPLIAVSTLKSIANGLAPPPPKGGNNDAFTPLWGTGGLLLCPMIDARRMEVYCAVYNQQLEEVLPIDARIISKDSFQDLLSKHQIIFLGNGAAKCKAALGSIPNALFSDMKISAAGMISLAEEKFKKKEFEDVALFEPFYLKEVAIGKKL